ncbi:unnamed protein product [Citrullus colocynthis]|uniref:Ubiquitin carboxyl-terminal hydrolase n=1 Tax=Citrullus colocynthis TaxID=252529 RepID=A0ABP0XRN4_9ROSI
MTVPASGFMMVNGGSSCLPLPPDVENQTVSDLVKQSESNLKEGNLYYVVSNRWYRRWQLYVGLSTEEFSSKDHSSDSQHCNMVPPNVVERPGPIDNSDIIVNGSDSSKNNDLELKSFLEERRDYVLVPSEVWEKLYDWYKGGPPLPRKMISVGVNQKNFSVEVYLLCLKLIDARDASECTIRLSKKATIFDLREKVCALKGIKQEKACIWDYFNQQKQLILDPTTQTLEELNLQMNQHILLEVDGPTPQTGMDATRNDLALVALEPSRSALSIAGGPVMSNGHSSGYGYQGSSLSTSVSDIDDRNDLSNTAKKKEKGGLAGLQNLGNTCFMNSALQCLVHTPPLVEYFLQDYSEEINAENPLGMHGELALAFGELLRKLWSGQTTIAPRVFKGKLARFAPQFSGYNQHDSQELLAFLLDGLHEDLNRVKRKPYFETKDSDGRPDAEVADECWRYHKARNDSLIVDVCQGQYKSTLVCPVCGKISITFDPFMYLSLPLPSTVTRSVTVTVFYGDGSGLPMPYTVTVQRHGYTKDLTNVLASACCLKSDENLLIAEVYDNRIFRYLDNPLESLTSIKDEEYLVAYRLPKRESGRPKLEIIHRSLEKCSMDRVKGMERKLFGTPLVTCLGENFHSGADINAAVSKILLPLRRTYPSTKAHGHDSKENGFVSEMNDEPGNCGPQSVSRSQSIDIEVEEASEKESSFQLLLTDDKGLSCKPIDKDSTIKYGPLIKVFLDWNDREHESYDVSYIKDLPPVHQTRFMKKTRQEAISLFSCLEAFLTEEPLGPDDMWYCPRCKEHRQATKKLDLWKLPEIIVFHLKRFSYSRFLKNKLDTFVDFPIHNLDLSKYVKSNDGKSYLYNLYAISNHYGGLGGGHYTAYAKLIDEKRWYHFDDSHVSPVGEEEIKTSAAYLLFYQRVEI